jgi:hypothetical protein
MHLMNRLALVLCFIMWSPLSRSHSNVWELVPIYSSEYKPRFIKEGFQMTHALSYSPSDPNIMYLCTDTSQIWRSNDSGLNWNHIGNGIMSYGCRSLAIDPYNSDRVVVAGFLGITVNKAKTRKNQHVQAIYLTENGGESWQSVHEADFYRQVSKSPLISYDPTTRKDGKTLVWYIGIYDAGLYISNDGGHSWMPLDSELQGICDIEAVPSKPGELLIATETGLFHYDKKTIYRIGQGLPEHTCAIAIHPNNPKYVFAAVGKEGIYKSEDGGKTFAASNKGLPILTPDITALAISHQHPYILYAKSNASRYRLPFFSMDLGESWNEGKYGDFINTHGKQQHFWFSSIFAPHPNNPYQCLTVSNGDGKVFRTDNGGASWDIFGTGYTGARVVDMSFENGDIYAALTDFGIWKGNVNDEYYVNMNVPKYKGQSSVHLLKKTKDYLIATVGTWNDQCVATKYLDNKWRLHPQIHGRFNSLIINPFDDSTIYLDDIVSFNNGETWKKLSKSVVANSGSKNNKVYSLDKEDTKEANLYISVSEDDGATWKRYSKTAPIDKATINSVIIDPFDEQRCYLASNNGIWIYDGSEWSRKGNNEGLENDKFGRNYINTIVADPAMRGRLFAGKAAPGQGMSNGIFESIDGGNTWNNITGSIGKAAYIWSMHIDTVSRMLYADTERGLFRLRIAD